MAWSIVERGGSDRLGIVAIDTASGRRVDLLSDADHEYSSPAVSPDGSRLAFVVATRPTPSEPQALHLATADLGDDGMSATNVQLIAADWDRWPGQPVWTPDGSALLVAADSDGCAPVFRVELDGTVTRLTGDHGAYSDVCVDPEGRYVYAMRSAIDAPAGARAHRSLGRRSAADDAARSRTRAAAAGFADRDLDRSGRRHHRPGLARAAGRSERGLARAPAVVGPRRAVGLVELVVVALEPVADGRRRLRGADARPGACPPATATRSSPAAGVLGAPSRTPI